MRRFFFDITAGAVVMPDREGDLMPDLPSAVTSAVLSLRELVCDYLRKGERLRITAIVIRDDKGRDIKQVTVSEALEPILPA